MLQDMYNDGFGLSLLWGEIWVLLFQEEVNLMGLGFGIVSIGFISSIPCFSLYLYFIFNF